MPGLNPIEHDCQDVLIMLRDMMSPGHKMNSVTHMEISGRVRDLLVKLRNKEFGCSTGKHGGPCACVGGYDGGPMPKRHP